LTQPEEIFIDPKDKKLENLRFLGEKFSNSNPIPKMADLTRPEQQNIDPT